MRPLAPGRAARPLRRPFGLAVGAGRELDHQHRAEDQHHRGDGPRGDGLVQDQPAEQDRHHRVHVGVGAHHGGGGVAQRVGVGGEADDRAEDDEVRQRADARGGPRPPARFAQDEPEQRDHHAAGEHLHRRGGVGRGVGRVPLGVHRAERPRCAREGERDRSGEVGVHQLTRRHAGEERAPQEAERQPGADPPGEDRGAARPQRVEERRPQRNGRDEDARRARLDVLLRPDDDRVAAEQQEEAGDREHLPVAEAPRQPVAGGEHDPGEEQARDDEADAGEEQRGQVHHPDPDREVGGAPDRADQEVGDQRLAAQPRHQSSSTGTMPGFSKSVESTIVVRVLTGWPGCLICRSTPSRLSIEGAATLST